MGLIGGTMNLLFGAGRNMVAETASAFWENPEARAERDVARQAAALEQFASEFALPKTSVFDKLIDGINRIPRPALALGTIGLFVSAMVDPVWFAARMQGIALVPEPLWWLMGAIVSFYFGARHQAKSQQFQSALAARVVANQRRGAAEPSASPVSKEPAAAPPNPALDDWTSHGF